MTAGEVAEVVHRPTHDNKGAVPGPGDPRVGEGRASGDGEDSVCRKKKSRNAQKGDQSYFFPRIKHNTILCHYLYKGDTFIC